MELSLESSTQRVVQESALEAESAQRAQEAHELEALLRRDVRLALEWIHKRFARVIHGLLLAHVGSADVEDLGQEVFLRIQHGLASLRDPVALPAWIATITRNLAIEHQRKRAREPQQVVLSESVAQASAPASDEDSLRQLVLTRLQELPEAYRETLAWRLIEGLTGPEIALRTGMQAASVRVNLCRGMALLRPLLQKDGVLE